MEVLLDITDRIYKYIEYIPMEVLPDILLEILEEGILANGARLKGAQGTQVGFDVDQLMAILQQHIQGLPKVQLPVGQLGIDVVESVIEEVQETVEEITIEEIVVEMEDDLDDFDDFDEFMK